MWSGPAHLSCFILALGLPAIQASGPQTGHVSSHHRAFAQPPHFPASCCSLIHLALATLLHLHISAGTASSRGATLTSQTRDASFVYCISRLQSHLLPFIKTYSTAMVGGCLFSPLNCPCEHGFRFAQITLTPCIQGTHRHKPVVGGLSQHQADGMRASQQILPPPQHLGLREVRGALCTAQVSSFLPPALPRIFCARGVGGIGYMLTPLQGNLPEGRNWALDGFGSP